jgi:hypothetical protein
LRPPPLVAAPLVHANGERLRATAPIDLTAPCGRGSVAGGLRDFANKYAAAPEQSGGSPVLTLCPGARLQWSASLWEATRIALDSLRKNKLRSFLTLLGIILATTTLIAVTALIHGMDRYIADKVSNMGADGFRIVRMAWFGEWDPKKFFEMDKRNPQIRVDEYEFIKEKATLLKDHRHDDARQARVAYKGNLGGGRDRQRHHRQHSGHQRRSGGNRARHHL